MPQPERVGVVIGKLKTSLPKREKMCLIVRRLQGMRLLMVPFSRLFEALNEIPDPRRAEGKRYPLAPLLLFTILALLSGAQSYRGILTFLKHRRETLNAVFGTHWKRAPALNTLPRCVAPSG